MLRGKIEEAQVIHSITELKRHRARLEDIRNSRLLAEEPLQIAELTQLNSEIRCVHGVEAHLQAMLSQTGHVRLH